MNCRKKIEMKATQLKKILQWKCSIIRIISRISTPRNNFLSMVCTKKKKSLESSKIQILFFRCWAVHQLQLYYYINYHEMKNRN